MPFECNKAFPIGTFDVWLKPLRLEYRFFRDGAGGGLMRVVCRAVDAVQRWVESELLPLHCGGATAFFGEFSDSFDHLWQRVAVQYPVIGIRDRRFLTARFADQRGRHRIFASLGREGTPDAYLVFTYERSGLVRIVDFLAVDPRRLRKLLRAFSRRMRAEGRQGLLLHYLGPAAVKRSLLHLGFGYVTGERVSLEFSPEWPAHARGSLTDGTQWYLTEADLDPVPISPPGYCLEDIPPAALVLTPVRNAADGSPKWRKNL